MKTKFLVLFVIIITLFFTSCSKNEVVDLSFNNKDELLKTKLAEIQNPNKDEVLDSLSDGLKSTEVSLIRIYTVEKEYYKISDNEAVKYFVLYRFADNYRKEFFTFKQVFDVVDGRIDESHYYIKFYSPGCPFSKDYYLENSDNILQMIFFLREDGGMQSVYISESNEGWRISIPQLSGVEWQMQVKYQIDGMEQPYQTGIIDRNTPKIELYKNIEKENIVSIVEMERARLIGLNSLYIIRNVQNEEFQSMSYLLMYSQNLPEIVSFAVPFGATDVYLCGENGCECISLSEFTYRIDNGIKIYTID